MNAIFMLKSLPFTISPLLSRTVGHHSSPRCGVSAIFATVQAGQVNDACYMPKAGSADEGASPQAPLPAIPEEKPEAVNLSSHGEQAHIGKPCPAVVLLINFEKRTNK